MRVVVLIYLLFFFSQFSLSILCSKHNSLFFVADRDVYEEKKGSLNDSVFSSDSISMQELLITATRKKAISLNGDTLVFNVESFNIPEGARLRELLKRIPGIEITDDGTVMAKGKPVSRILLNGKRFFGNDKEIALDNLPADILLEVKVYDKKTEVAEFTGVDDGAAEQVLDVVTKEDNDNGWFGDLGVGYGTEERYNYSAAASQFNDIWQNMISVTLHNNTARKGINTGCYGKTVNNNGNSDVDRQDYNVLLGYTKGKLQLNSSLGKGNAKNKNGSMHLAQRFMDENDIYTHSLNDGVSSTSDWNFNTDVLFEDSLFMITWNPSFVFSDYTYDGVSQSTTFLNKPCHWNIEPLDIFNTIPFSDRINYSSANDRSNDRNYSINSNLRIVRRLQKKRRNIEFSWIASKDFFNSDAFAYAGVFYYLDNNISSDISLRNILNKKHSDKQGFGVAYTEPLAEKWLLQASYKYNYIKERDNKDVYDFLTGNKLRVDSLSSLTKNIIKSHFVSLDFQYKGERWNVTSGIQIEPQCLYSNLLQKERVVDTSRVLLNFSPRLYASYKNNEVNVTLYYNGKSSFPDIAKLTDVEDNTNPLFRKKGNIALKPSFCHVFGGNIFKFDPITYKQLSFAMNAGFEQNAISYITVLDRSTGISLISPFNSKGEIKLGGDFMITAPLKSLYDWKIYNHSSVQCDIEPFRRCIIDDDKIITDENINNKTITLSDYFSLEYLYKIIEIQAYGYVDYYGRFGKIVSSGANYRLLYGGGLTCSCILDCGFSFTTDIYRQCRRGFEQTGIDNASWICNIELKYRFLKERKAEISLVGYDLFSQSNSLDCIWGEMSKVEINYLYSLRNYVMLNFTYNFNFF